MLECLPVCWCLKSQSRSSSCAHFPLGGWYGACFYFEKTAQSKCLCSSLWTALLYSEETFGFLIQCCLMCMFEHNMCSALICQDIMPEQGIILNLNCASPQVYWICCEALTHSTEVLLLCLIFLFALHVFLYLSHIQKHVCVLVNSSFTGPWIPLALCLGDTLKTLAPKRFSSTLVRSSAPDCGAEENYWGTEELLWYCWATV